LDAKANAIVVLQPMIMKILNEDVVIQSAHHAHQAVALSAKASVVIQSFSHQIDYRALNVLEVIVTLVIWK